MNGHTHPDCKHQDVLVVPGMRCVECVSLNNAVTLWAFCPHCETLFVNVIGRIVVHSCPGKQAEPDPDSDDEFVRCAGRSAWRGFVKSVGMRVELEVKAAKRVVR